MDSNQKAVFGFLLGLTAGAVAGLLLAPEAGTDTRRKLSDRANRYREDLNGQINSAIGKLSKYSEQAKGLVAEAESKLKSQYN